MPGFFLTFILLSFAAGWGRFLADRNGRNWPMVLPGATLVIWCLLTVFGVAASMQVMGDGQHLEEDSARLGRVLWAAQMTRYLSVGSLLAMIPITAVAWMQTPQTPGEEQADRSAS